MAQTVKHAKVSGVPDGSDPNQIQPSNWNADHTVTGTVDYSELSGKPSTFPPGTHTHVIADTTGLQTALDTKVAGPASSVADAPTIFNGTTGKLVKETTYASFKTSLSLTKSDVGLGNVDNTSDANKPVSTAQQTALNLKADLASPTFTGDPKAPTPSPGDNDTSIATTAYVTAAVSAGTTAAPRASTTEVLTGTDNVKIVTADAAAALWEKGPDVLSAATISLGEGGFFHITGTNAITDVDFATAKDGRQAWVVFDGIVTLTHSATLQLPGDANIITAAGDRACFVQDVGDTVICVSYLRDSGKPVAGGASVSIGDAPPASPDPGALWWESDTGRLMIWYDDGTSQQWVEVLAGGSNATLPVQGWRNRIINGDFSIDQRTNGSGVTVASGTSAYTLDRWVVAAGQAPGTIFVQRIADSTLAGEYYMYVAPNVIDATIAAADYYSIAQLIEGNMCRGLNWGTAYAKPITISFNCTAVGGPFTLGFSVANSAGDRTWSGSFTTGTNRISITVPGDTTGTWVHDNGIGIRIKIGLAYGTTYQGGAGWQAGNFFGIAGTSNFMSSGANTLSFKDFQVEVGTQATEFERVPYPDQLARCQRYAWRKDYTANTPHLGNKAPGVSLMGELVYPVSMRTTPTSVLSTTANWQYMNTGAAWTAVGGTPASYTHTDTSCWFGFGTVDAESVPRMYRNTAGATILFSAEI